MHFTRAVIVCMGYFLTSVLSIGLNSVQLEELVRLYGNIKESTNENTEKNITKVMIEFFEIEQPTTIFKYDSNLDDFVNLYNLLMVLAEKDNKNSGEVKVKKLTPFEVEYYLYKFHAHPECVNQLGYLTLQQLLEIFKNLKLKDVLTAKSKELEWKNDDDDRINAAEFLLKVLESKPEGNGLTLEQIEMFNNLYEAHKTVSGKIDPVESQKVFEDLDITSREDDLNLLLNTNRPAEKVLMDLIIIAAERSRTVKKNESRLLGPAEIVLCVNEFNKFDVNEDGVLSDNEYGSFVDDFKKEFNKMKEPAKKSLTFEVVQKFFEKFDSSDGIEVKKVINIVEFLEIIWFITNDIEETISVDSSTDRLDHS